MARRSKIDVYDQILIVVCHSKIDVYNLDWTANLISRSLGNLKIFKNVSTMLNYVKKLV